MTNTLSDDKTVCDAYYMRALGLDEYFGLWHDQSGNEHHLQEFSSHSTGKTIREFIDEQNNTEND